MLREAYTSSWRRNPEVWLGNEEKEGKMDIRAGESKAKDVC